LAKHPDFSRPEFSEFDAPVLLDEFTLPDGRRAEHWDLAPSHENDTFAYTLWVEGPGEHMYFSSGQSIDEAALVAQSLRMTRQGSDIGVCVVRFRASRNRRTTGAFLPHGPEGSSERSRGEDQYHLPN
jgi:hypothetical protein